MDSKSRLKTAQMEILESLADLENHLADMYAAFAARFESSRSFWLKISRDEASHARMVLSLKRQLDAGFHFWNLEAFHPDAVKQQIQLLEQQAAFQTKSEA
ncbi:MAG: hypothetical protein A2340_09185 [Lentisphaerae bacterium RIFOXYB12_FULL_60_10]|nr:MAG: hypothetical protein A2340_09185 [Lentisphaerae bacterium RIFOXYB12_FULL_60_10]